MGSNHSIQYHNFIMIKLTHLVTRTKKTSKHALRSLENWACCGDSAVCCIMGVLSAGTKHSRRGFRPVGFILLSPLHFKKSGQIIWILGHRLASQVAGLGEAYAGPPAGVIKSSISLEPLLGLTLWDWARWNHVEPHHGCECSTTLQSSDSQNWAQISRMPAPFSSGTLQSHLNFHGLSMSTTVLLRRSVSTTTTVWLLADGNGICRLV